MYRNLSLRIIVALAALMLILVGGAMAAEPEKQDPEEQKTKVSEKRRTSRPEIAGGFAGPTSATRGIKVGIFRREEGGLTAAGTAVSDEHGQFRFEGLTSGEYILTPDLATLPEGFGLYRRHANVYVNALPTTVEFELGQIKRFEIFPGSDYKIVLDEPFFAEAFAKDAHGAHLFAAVEITVSGDLDVTARADNGVKLKPKKDGKHQMTARNGSVSESVTLTIR